MAIELGDQPTPEIEPAEPNPGGVDAIDGEDSQTMPVVPDLSLVDNPAVDGAPDELSEPEETDEGASSDGASEPEKESPA
jgi:hypothetical protein